VPLLADANQANVVASMDGVEPRQSIVDPGVTACSVLVTSLNRYPFRQLANVVPLLAGANQANVVASMDGVEPRQTIVDPGVTARSVLVSCLN
jgi:hypothetical protein